jgi:hypothetical protein
MIHIALSVERCMFAVQTFDVLQWPSEQLEIISIALSMILIEEQIVTCTNLIQSEEFRPYLFLGIACYELQR